MNKYALSFKSSADLLKYIEEQDVQYIDFNFTDLRGKWQHSTFRCGYVDKDVLETGVFFDGSSIAGWRAINESDMTLIPDLNKVTYDPFSAQKTLKIFCDVSIPGSREGYGRDPRSVAKAAEQYLKKTGLGDTAFFGPEVEFFIFDSVRIHTDMNHVSYEVDSTEGPYNSGRDYPTGNMGHRPGVKGG
ncbi:MAG: glutamine synthetase beta-grasp domain-containing protein, partial [Alphaproteobacteria bacterium]|nr:glutamine synthetase beta-grasp domain-containing protein [Alphaproteobacteria bacterium]